MKRKILAVVLASMILIICAVPVYGTNTKADKGSFSDVSAGHWAYNAIKWMIDNNIVEGTGGDQFLPSRLVTRDEFAKMMVLTLNLKLINPERASFLDIKKGGWQYKYVETAKPYITGFKTTTGDYYHPSQAAVREDMAVALVKALGFDKEIADLDLLSQFNDAAAISPNLKKFVAIAVKHNLMEGYDKDGKRVFGPDAGLDRASAATLLFNVFKENEEKITYDEEKITYENGNTNTNDDEECDEDKDDDEDSNLASTRVSVDVVDGKAVVKWNKITASNFTGYKVVISKNDSTPVYPENGYFQYITDRSTLSTVVQAGDNYNGGDFGGTIQSGAEYYFSVTVLYNNGKAAGNAVRVALP